MPTLLLYDASPAPGGALTSACALMEELLSAGWRVVAVFAEVQVWGAFEAWRARLGAGSDALRGLALGVSAQVGWSGASWVARELVRARALAPHLWSVRPDVVLANNGPQANAAALWMARGAGVRCVQYVRGPIHGSALAARLLALSAARFVVGREALAALAALGFDAQLVGEGLSASQLPTARESGAAPRWLWASALVEWKGLELLTQVYGALEQRAPLDIAYIPVSSPERAALPPLPAGATAHCMPERLDAMRASSLVYVHTALVPEPFGRSVLEAQLAGLCAVVPDEGGPAAQVEHERTGLLYPARSREGLAAALARVAASPALAAQLGAQARRAVEARGSAGAAFAPVIAACAGAVR
jgi:glycosyltransferase involved in cell wall biosynthesis